MTLRLPRSLRVAVAAAFTVGALCLVSDAPAGTATSNVDVTATVVANCTISTSSALAFGDYDPVGANATTAKDATGTLSVACTNGSAAAITLGQGAHANTGSTDAAPLRRMQLGATTNFLSYSVFRDSARTLTWSNEATNDLEITGTGMATTQTLYGRVPAAQNVPVGAYADVVVATVTF